ncbi:MAG: tRNA uridine-5-carboxymethylaminomethyl(34) synthesis GTPase MnmE [Clostridia bacterium]|nr:tRNA uridine-5-carboxymethylaminomethyl(34) synthesis GTPase MnmE [Clostridia bacterium]
MEHNIAAIATPAGKGGVAIVRISGKSPLDLASKMFEPVGGVKVKDFEPYKMYAGKIDGGTFTDFGLCVYFKAPKSYTGEDIVEFHCHGGENIARGILKKTFSLGARSAEKGEFTKRAFLNGKLSLAAAEGVADMINAESDAEVRAGYNLYTKTLTREICVFQTELTTVLAKIDVTIDYPDEYAEDLEEETAQIKRSLEDVRERLARLAERYNTEKKIKSGVTVAICGKPNTGKSSLLNTLLGYEKAIVSNIAGTTRDAVEGVIEIEGRKFNLYDTAGVRESGDKIESIGIERAENIIRSADVAIFVADLTQGLSEEDGRVLEMLKNKPLIKIINKSDLLRDDTESDADVLVSAVTGEGINKLKELLFEKAYGAKESLHEAFLIEERHYNALMRAKETLARAVNACAVEPLELVAVDVKETWDILGEITGETATETIIGEIFEKFCVGK